MDVDRAIDRAFAEKSGDPRVLMTRAINDNIILAREVQRLRGIVAKLEIPLEDASIMRKPFWEVMSILFEEEEDQ